MSRCPSSVGEQRTNTGPVHRISIKHERFDQRWRNVVPASSTLSKPCPSIGPNLRAWWVPRKHDTSTQCWSNVGQRLLAQHWSSTGPMYRVCRVLYHVWNRRIYYSVHKQRPTVRHDIEVKSVLHKWPERHASKDETLSTTPVQRWANIDDSGPTLD